jgi:hypothetical protein
MKMLSENLQRLRRMRPVRLSGSTHTTSLERNLPRDVHSLDGKRVPKWLYGLSPGNLFQICKAIRHCLVHGGVPVDVLFVGCS